MPRRLATAVASLVAFALLGLTTASAAGRGGDHGILFTRTTRTRTDIYLSKPGRRPLRLTWGRYDASRDPEWSPNGRLIAYTAETAVASPANSPGTCSDNDECVPEIWVMRANGSGKRLLTAHDPGVFAADPSWSPDGRRIVFVRGLGNKDAELAVVSLQSGRERSLGVLGGAPAWGPRGIAFAGGGGIRLLDLRTHRSRILAHRQTRGLSWSPDGSRLASLSDYVKSQGFETPDLYFARVTVYAISGRVLSTFDVRTNSDTQVCGVSWTPDGTHLLVTKINGRVFEVDTAGRAWARLPLRSGETCSGAATWR